MERIRNPEVIPIRKFFWTQRAGDGTDGSQAVGGRGTHVFQGLVPELLGAVAQGVDEKSVRQQDQCSGVPVGLEQRADPARVAAGELEQDAAELLARVGRPAVVPVDDAHPAVRGRQHVVGPQVAVAGLPRLRRLDPGLKRDQFVTQIGQFARERGSRTGQPPDQVVPAGGPDRLTTAGVLGLPQVLCPCAIEVLVFNEPETVPAQYRDRRLVRHSPQITDLRLTRKEMADVGREVGRRLSSTRNDAFFLIPKAGYDSYATRGEPFFDPEADAALFESLEKGLRQNDRRRLMRLPFHINDAEFAAALADHFIALAG